MFVAVRDKSPTPISESGDYHRRNDEAYSPPAAQMATGFGDLINESEIGDEIGDRPRLNRKSTARLQKNVVCPRYRPG